MGQHCSSLLMMLLLWASTAPIFDEPVADEVEGIHLVRTRAAVTYRTAPRYRYYAAPRPVVRQPSYSQPLFRSRGFGAACLPGGI